MKFPDTGLRRGPRDGICGYTGNRRGIGDLDALVAGIGCAGVELTAPIRVQVEFRSRMRFELRKVLQVADRRERSIRTRRRICELRGTITAHTVAADNLQAGNVLVVFERNRSAHTQTTRKAGVIVRARDVRSEKWNPVAPVQGASTAGVVGVGVLPAVVPAIAQG